MNQVILIGRLTSDPMLKYGQTTNNAICRFSVAVDKGKDKNGKALGADYPNCKAFGRSAEMIEQFFKKGNRIAISGRLETGSYEKDGRKVFTTEVVVERWEFVEGKSSADDTPSGFSKADDIPF